MPHPEKPDRDIDDPASDEAPTLTDRLSGPRERAGLAIALFLTTALMLWGVYAAIGGAERQAYHQAIERLAFLPTAPRISLVTWVKDMKEWRALVTRSI